MSENIFTVEQMTAARRAYQREWRAKNREKVKEYNARFWSKKCAEKMLAEKKEKSDGA